MTTHNQYSTHEHHPPLPRAADALLHRLWFSCRMWQRIAWAERRQAVRLAQENEMLRQRLDDISRAWVRLEDV